ncbi:MAG: hypothetical protein ABSC04_16155 [Syntrophobacteraceae bacterium]
MPKRLLRVSEIRKGENFPFSKSWVYKVAHMKRHAGLLLKIDSGLFVDLDAFDKLAEKGRLR